MADGDRAFYGGQPPTSGEHITAGKYTGPEAEVAAPWKCPACGVQNDAPLKYGCVHCGSGKPGYHVDTPQVGRPEAEPTILPATHHVDPDQIAEAFAGWLRQQAGPTALHATENERILRLAFSAGWVLGQQRLFMTSPARPEAASAPGPLTPEAKSYRTIIAALEIFKDQILSLGPDEITTGEWCSPSEVEALIDQLKAGL